MSRRLLNELKELTERFPSFGLDLFGVADLRTAKEYILKESKGSFGFHPYAVSIGIKLSDSIVNQLFKHDDPVPLSVYEHHIYNVVSPRLDDIALLITQFLQGKGYQAYPVPSSFYSNVSAKKKEEMSSEDLKGVFSHKLAANLAGFGWIGKNCLFVSPDFGPRVRLSTVLTDAPLPSSRPLPDLCENCSLCVDICPPNALKGKKFNSEEEREERFDAVKCNKYRAELKKERVNRACGLCMFICPYGNSQVEKELSAPKIPKPY